ncbi:MAG: VWA domain-containing protein [Prevotellaceae bacterium]|jgi:Mg-chelatase subunit ChlD|nr:VWA domain-containing protein [Prevotellaceae bacterium]
MEKKHQVHNLIILDESGSMESIKTTIIQGFNELVQTIQGIEKQFPEQEHFISFVSFNGLGQKLLHFIDPASKLKQINDKTYNPDASTPLFDAMGFSINKLKQSLQGQTDYNVLVTILTDGEENASKEFSGNDIKKLVEELKQNRWTFTYIGTDHDVEKIAISLSINNTMVFEKSEAGIKDMFLKEQSSRTAYSQKIRSKEDTTSNYFEDTEADENKK